MIIKEGREQERERARKSLLAHLIVRLINCFDIIIQFEVVGTVIETSNNVQHVQLIESDIYKHRVKILVY